MSADIRELLNVKVEDLAINLKGGGVTSVDKNASLPEVLQILAEHDIRSVPVVDKSDNGRLLGLVDMVDIIAFIVRFAEECHSLPAAQRNFEWFSEQLAKSGQTISQIAGLANKSKLVPVQKGTSLHDIIQIMVSNSTQRRENGCRVEADSGQIPQERVPVLDADNKLVNFVTQSTLIQYFAKNSAKLGKYGDLSLSELGFQKKKVYGVKENAVAIDAFKLMVEHKITGVPIMDNDSTIITNVSSRELRSVLTDPEFFEKLQFPVERFVSDLKSKTFLHTAHAETMYPKICCKFTSKFAEVLHKLAATKIHRIYVVDNTDHPVSVISLHDIVAKVFELSSKNERVNDEGVSPS